MTSHSSPSIHFISAQEVEAALKYDDLIPAMEGALADFSRCREGGVIQPLRTVLSVEDHGGWVHYNWFHFVPRLIRCSTHRNLHPTMGEYARPQLCVHLYQGVHLPILG